MLWASWILCQYAMVPPTPSTLLLKPPSSHFSKLFLEPTPGEADVHLPRTDPLGQLDVIRVLRSVRQCSQIINKWSQSLTKVDKWQMLKNRITVSLWKQRLAYYTLHLVQSPTSDIGRLTYVSQWLQSSLLSQQFFFMYSVLMLDPIQCNGLIHRSTRSVILLMSIKPFAMSSFLWFSWNVEVK